MATYNVTVSVEDVTVGRLVLAALGVAILVYGTGTALRRRDLTLGAMLTGGAVSIAGSAALFFTGETAGALALGGLGCAGLCGGLATWRDSDALDFATTIILGSWLLLWGVVTVTFAVQLGTALIIVGLIVIGSGAVEAHDRTVFGQFRARWRTLISAPGSPDLLAAGQRQTTAAASNNGSRQRRTRTERIRPPADPAGQMRSPFSSTR